MNKLSIALLSVTALAGLAFAGDPKADPKATTKADAPKTDAKAPAAAPMEMPKPPQELADMAKTAAGTWKCKGQGMGHDMKMAEMTGTMTIKLDVDNWWLHGSFSSKMGKEPFHFESYTTYDPTAKKWHRVMVESGGGWSTGDATASAGKMDWELATHSMMGDGMFRDHEDNSDLKAGSHNWGEMSMDKGKTWVKVYDMTCKK